MLGRRASEFVVVPRSPRPDLNRKNNQMSFTDPLTTQAGTPHATKVHTFPAPLLPYVAALNAYTQTGAASILRPIPAQETPPKGFRDWNPTRAEAWAAYEHWTDARTASSPAPGFAFLDDDDAALVTALEAKLGVRPSTLYTTSRGPLSATQGRAKRLYRVPADAALKGEYSGGEIVDHFHRFAFIAPTINTKTVAVEVWHLPNGEPLNRVLTADDIAAHVAELPAAWLEYLKRDRPYGEAPAYAGSLDFDAGEVAPWLAALAETWGDWTQYPDANTALVRLAGVAVMIPETQGIDTLRQAITHAYASHDSTKSVESMESTMQRAWESALATQAAERDALAAEITPAALHWAVQTLGTPEPVDTRTAYEKSWAGDNSGYAEQRAPQPIPESWVPRSTAEYLDSSYEPPKPEVLRRSDGLGLFYRGAVNEIHGAAGDGKTMVAIACAVEVLQSGGRVLYLNYEEPDGRLISRFTLLGAKADWITSRFDHVRPEERPTDATLAHLVAQGYDLVVIDTVGESIQNVTGGDSNSTDDVTEWHQFARAFSNAGACVLAVDHITKAAADEGGSRALMPIGSQAKFAGYKGAVYFLEPARTGGLKQGAEGSLRLKLAKDNGGGLGLAKGDLAGTFQLDSRTAPALWEVRAPLGAEALAELMASRDAAKAVGLAGEILDAVKAEGGSPSQSALRKALGLPGNHWGRYKTAYDALLDNGTLKLTPGARNSTLVSITSPSPIVSPPTPLKGLREGGETHMPASAENLDFPSPGRDREGGEAQISASARVSPEPLLTGKLDDLVDTPRSILAGITDAELDALLEEGEPSQPEADAAWEALYGDDGTDTRFDNPPSAPSWLMGGAK